MPLVPAKCPSCGGDMQIDGSRKEACCPYCGSKFLVESAVNYYNTKNEYHIEHANIKMEDSRGLEARVKNAESYLVQHKDYEKAKELFQSITEEFAGDWRGWWGVVRADTYDFTGAYFKLSGAKEDGYIDFNRGTEQFTPVQYEPPRTTMKYLNGALNVMDPEMRKEHEKIWDAYMAKALRCWEKYRDEQFSTYPDRRRLRLKIDELDTTTALNSYRSGLGKRRKVNRAEKQSEELREEYKKKYKGWFSLECGFYDFEKGFIKYSMIL